MFRIVIKYYFGTHIRILLLLVLFHIREQSSHQHLFFLNISHELKRFDLTKTNLFHFFVRIFKKGDREGDQAGP